MFYNHKQINTLKHIRICWLITVLLSNNKSIKNAWVSYHTHSEHER